MIFKFLQSLIPASLGRHKKYPLDASMTLLKQAHFSPGGLKVIQKLQKNGFQAYFVGGCIRDILLGKSPKDFDIATDARPRQITALFSNAIIIGKRFTLVHIRFQNELIEVATFRRDHGPSSKGESEILKNDNAYGSLEDDVVRRDFTMNAMYYDPISHQLIDKFHGLNDLIERRVRTIGIDERRFTEDPVRMIRAVRYAAKLNLKISSEIEKALHSKSLLLAHVPKARLYEEYLKCFNHEQAATVFELMVKYNLIRHFVPKKLLHHKQLNQIQLLLKYAITHCSVKEHIPFLITFAMIAPSWSQWTPQEEKRELDHIMQSFQLLISIPRPIEFALNEVLFQQEPTSEQIQRYRMLPKIKSLKAFCDQMLKATKISKVAKKKH